MKDTSWWNAGSMAFRYGKSYRQTSKGAWPTIWLRRNTPTPTSRKFGPLFPRNLSRCGPSYERLSSPVGFRLKRLKDDWDFRTTGTGSAAEVMRGPDKAQARQ